MNNDESLYPRISESVAKTGTEFPEFMSKRFARILQRCELLWGEKEAIDYLDLLLFGDDHKDKKNWLDRADHSDISPNADHAHRHGFPNEAVSEIILLKQVHQLQFSSTSLDPYKYFGGPEIVPLNMPAGTYEYPESAPVSKTNNDIDFVQPDESNSDRKRLANGAVDSFAKGKKFIVVGNDWSVAQSIIGWLEGLGGTVEFFQNTEDVLHHANVQYADYYIVDHMPDGMLNGTQLLSLLRLKRHEPISAVLVTGDTPGNFSPNETHCNWPVQYKPINMPKLLSSLIAQAHDANKPP